MARNAPAQFATSIMPPILPAIDPITSYAASPIVIPPYT